MASSYPWFDELWRVSARLLSPDSHGHRSPEPLRTKRSPRYRAIDDRLRETGFTFFPRNLPRNATKPAMLTP